MFTPDQLQSAVKQAGNKRLKSESDAGISVLGNTLPSSGTAERTGVGTALSTIGGMFGGLPGAFTSLAVPAVSSAAIYNEPMMRMLTKLATERPEVMKILEPTISKQLANIGAIKGAEPSRKE